MKTKSRTVERTKNGNFLVTTRTLSSLSSSHDQVLIISKILKCFDISKLASDYSMVNNDKDSFDNKQEVRLEYLRNKNRILQILNSSNQTLWIFENLTKSEAEVLAKDFENLINIFQLYDGNTSKNLKYLLSNRKSDVKLIAMNRTNLLRLSLVYKFDSLVEIQFSTVLSLDDHSQIFIFRQVKYLPNLKALMVCSNSSRRSRTSLKIAADVKFDELHENNFLDLMNFKWQKEVHLVYKLFLVTEHEARFIFHQIGRTMGTVFKNVGIRYIPWTPSKFRDLAYKGMEVK